MWMMDGWTRVTHPFFSSTFCPLLWVWSSRSWSEGSALYRRCRVWIYIVIGEEHEERKGEREGGWEGQGVFFDLYYVVSILLVFLNVLILLYLSPSSSTLSSFFRDHPTRSMGFRFLSIQSFCFFVSCVCFWLRHIVSLFSLFSLFFLFFSFLFFSISISHPPCVCFAFRKSHYQFGDEVFSFGFILTS